jgi:hypothetical protein
MGSPYPSAALDVGGRPVRPLELPDFRAYAVEVPRRGEEHLAPEAASWRC